MSRLRICHMRYFEQQKKPAKQNFIGKIRQAHDVVRLAKPDRLVKLSYFSDKWLRFPLRLKILTPKYTFTPPFSSRLTERLGVRRLLLGQLLVLEEQSCLTVRAEHLARLVA